MKTFLMVIGGLVYLILLVMLVFRAEATGSNLRFIVYGVVFLIYVAIIGIGIREKKKRNSGKIK